MHESMHVSMHESMHESGCNIGGYVSFGVYLHDCLLTIRSSFQRQQSILALTSIIQMSGSSSASLAVDCLLSSRMIGRALRMVAAFFCLPSMCASMACEMECSVSVWISCREMTNYYTLSRSSQSIRSLGLRWGSDSFRRKSPGIPIISSTLQFRIILCRMFVDEKSFKSSFLLKKEEEKKKNKLQQQQRKNAILLQRHLRSYLARRCLLKEAEREGNIRLSLLMRDCLQSYEEEVVCKYLRAMEKERAFHLVYLKPSIMASLVNSNLNHLAEQLLRELEREASESFKRSFYSDSATISRVLALWTTNKYPRICEIAFRHLSALHLLSKIPPHTLSSLLLRQFSPEHMHAENDLSSQTVLAIATHLQSIKHPLPADFFSVSNLAIQLISGRDQNCAVYLLDQLLEIGVNRLNALLKEALDNYQGLISMIQDEEDLHYCEGLVRQHESVEPFCNQFLRVMERILTHPYIRQSNPSKQMQEILLKIIDALRQRFEDRQLIFMRTLLSSPWLLSSTQNYFYYEALHLKLISMDDIEFKDTQIYSTAKWGQFIQVAINKAFDLIRICILRRKGNKKSLVLFEAREQHEKQLGTIVQLLNDLYKKALRTSIIPIEYFTKPNFTNSLSKFSFGVGAEAIQTMLAKTPFVFNFESRLRKLKQFIKEDKSKHDRTLFLQQQVDPDLIIHVRRGCEFQDAFKHCLTRDLRRKYKIVFFNEQGLQEEGIDGGGILKEFINRVLRSSFSQIYGMFYETPLNEVLPFSASPLEVEYEFVGRIVGKAVYQGINIEQKFAEPFLNLVIGRQNSLEDMQFIDPEIYRSLITIKHMREDVSCLDQTFTILDSLPNGHKQYVNLLSPNRPSSKQTPVTDANKLDFILTYVDYKCNKQINTKTRAFRKGFLTVIKPEWLTMFNNQELNLIISGGQPDFLVADLKANVVYKDYHEKQPTIIYFWQVISELSPANKAAFLLFVTSCSRPPTLGFGGMKPRMCISREADPQRLPTANTCMNTLKLPDYKDQQLLRKKLLMAIHSKSGFELG